MFVFKTPQESSKNFTLKTLVFQTLNNEILYHLALPSLYSETYSRVRVDRTVPSDTGRRPDNTHTLYLEAE